MGIITDHWVKKETCLDRAEIMTIWIFWVVLSPVFVCDWLYYKFIKSRKNF